MTDSQHFALELIAAFIAMCIGGWIVSAFRDGWRNANRLIDTGIALALDPLDETWATVHRDHVDAPTFADLRARWDLWETEVRCG